MPWATVPMIILVVTALGVMSMSVRVGLWAGS